jgi:hypothetical protein
MKQAIVGLSVLPIASLRKLSVEEQDKLARSVVSLETKSKDAADAHKSSFPMAGKVVCMIEERLNELKSDRNPDGSPKKRMIAANTSLATYWESVTKVDGKSSKLNNHALSCAVAFGTYVRSELIEETHYDKCKAVWLEIAASISTQVGGDINHDAVRAAADELIDRSKDVQKNLLNILAGVKEPKALTVEQAQKALDKIFASGHLNLVISGIGAEIAHLEDTEAARSAFFGMNLSMEMFAANVHVVATDAVDKAGKPVPAEVRRFDDATLDAWSQAYAAQGNSSPESTETETQEVPEAEAQAA